MWRCGTVTEPLSCYTAALAAYLAGVVEDPAAHLAGSVRLAVRTSTPVPAYSHHRFALHHLPGGSALRYASAGTFAGAADVLAGELARHRAVLAVADTYGVPWSPAHRRTSATHWILVDGGGPGRWHVRDTFAALLPAGEQKPYEGWVDDRVLAEVLTLTGPVTDRDRYVFGVALEPPASPYRWLTRGPAGPAASSPPHEAWAEGGAAIDHLAEWFAAAGPAAEPHLDDVWAVARHHELRYRWLAATGAVPGDEAERATQAWRALPRSLHFAVGSARRGRPRAAVIRAGFDSVRPWVAEPGEQP